jgi:3-hydroxybutyryl-CoA dehydrogenase
MRADDVKRVAVVGAGTMGNGIAHVFAQSGYAVTLVDVARDFLDRAIRTIEQNLRRQVEKGKLPEEAINGTLSRIAIAAELETAAEAQLVIEAVTEDPETKFSLLRKLDEICPPETVFGSNTSSISITEIGAATQRVDRVIGMHFMNPVPIMPLVEVVRGIGTSDETLNLVMETAKRLGKTPVEVNDYPGFVSNRVLMPMINEAVYCVMEGVAKPESIDTVMKLGMNHPMGPLALADLIGLDTCLSIMEVLHDGFGDDKYRPCPLLRKMVRAGQLGRKTGQGFYTYKGK